MHFDPAAAFPHFTLFHFTTINFSASPASTMSCSSVSSTSPLISLTISPFQICVSLLLLLLLLLPPSLFLILTLLSISFQEYVSHSMLLKAHDICAMLLRCKITRPTLRITSPGTGAIFTGSNLPRESRERHQVQASGDRGAGSMQVHETVSVGPGGASTRSSDIAHEPEIIAEEEGDWD